MFEGMLISLLLFGVVAGFIVTQYYYKNKINQKEIILMDQIVLSKEKDKQIVEYENQLNTLNEGSSKIKNENNISKNTIEKLGIKLSEMEENTKKLEARIRVMRDDFTIIDGIGKKVSSILISSKIDTFQKLASIDQSTLKKIIEDVDPRILRLTDITTWYEQARLAADNNWEELSALKLKIKDRKKTK